MTNKMTYKNIKEETIWDIEKIEAKADVCDRSCWCHYCKEAIAKGEHYAVIYKKAMRGIARVNLCCLCLKKITNSIPKQDILSMENRLALKELEK
jgi:hypothetical protein